VKRLPQQYHIHRESCHRNAAQPSTALTSKLLLRLNSQPLPAAALLHMHHSCELPNPAA
jgi:hypothetical protein